MSLRSSSWRIRIGTTATGMVATGLFLGTFLALPSRAQTQPPAEKPQAADEKAGPVADRKKAMELFNAHQHLEALPLLEVLAKADPKDRVVQERLAIALLTKSVTVGADEDAPCGAGAGRSCWR